MPKSILKKSPLPVTSPSSQITSRQQRNQEIALEHAHIIQQRKDVEAQIVAATEILLDFPSSPTSTAASPTSEDAARTKDLIKLFQPTDFDSLVEERNIDGKCGYVLCPLPHRTENTAGRFRIIMSGGSDSLKVIEKGKLEQWCSDDCGRRALYIRVQLSEEPAWTYAGSTDEKIQLYGEHDHNRRLHRSKEESDSADAYNKLEQLAIERGEMTVKRILPGMSDLSLHETLVPSRDIPSPPGLSNEPNQDPTRTHNMIEGHIPKVPGIGQHHREDSHEENEDIMDII